jgi:hypothetical protein
MPFDDEHDGGDGDGHRAPDEYHCEAMQDMILDYARRHGLCKDCVMAKMGAGLLTQAAFAGVVDRDGVLDLEAFKDRLKRVMSLFRAMVRITLEHMNGGGK